jgi:GNAT superfamily N-acetyltransferase
MFTIYQPSEESFPDTYRWHANAAGSDVYVYPRAMGEFERLVSAGNVWCASDLAGEMCGMTYFARDGVDWEIGGLMVSEALRGRGIASILIRLALCNILVEHEPIAHGSRVIAHVHRDNNRPRHLITETLLFKHSKSISVPAEKLPGLFADSDGFIYGDEFEMQFPTSIAAQVNWCKRWRGKLKDGTPLTIKLPRQRTLAQWAIDLQTMCDGS